MMRKILAFVIFALLFFTFLVNSNLSPGITICDVGQGDGTIIKIGDGKIILDDCGPDNSIMRCLSDELGFWKKDIDMLIISHPHSDHFWGCFSVLDHYDIKNVFISGAPIIDKGYQELMNRFSDEGVKIYQPDSGDGINLSDNCHLLFIKTDYQGTNLNNFSLGIRLDCNGTSFLSLGDLEEDEEDNIDENISADIFKLSHHGSVTSNSYNLLEKIMPEVAVVSVGSSNSYGHPDSNTLSRVKGLGAKIWRTDKDGDFNFYFNIR